MYRLILFFTFERLLILMGISTVAFFALTFTVGFAWSWPFLLIMIFLFIRYLLLGSVGAAARKLQDQDFDGAERMLKYTWKPQWLQFGMQAMYYFLRGTIAMFRQDLAKAETEFKTAIDLGLPDADSQIMAYVNLAGIQLRKNNRTQAKEYAVKARKLKPTNSMIEDYLSQIEKALQAPNVGIQHQQMMYGKGGRKMKR